MDYLWMFLPLDGSCNSPAYSLTLFCCILASTFLQSKFHVLAMSKLLKTCLVLTRARAVHVCDAFLFALFRVQLKS